MVDDGKHQQLNYTRSLVYEILVIPKKWPLVVETVVNNITIKHVVCTKNF